MSGKKSLVVNGQKAFEKKQFKGEFRYPFSLGKLNCCIVESKVQGYDLKVNDRSFA